MSVSGQVREQSETVERGPRARMRRHMLSTAIRLMQDGFVPSVSDVAEAAEVSRATAYRYFPSQAAMVQATVDEALEQGVEQTERRRLERLPHHINEPEFSAALAERFRQIAS